MNETQLVRDERGHYSANGSVTADEVLATAAAILFGKCQRLGVLSNPSDVKQFLQMRLSGSLVERFEALWLDQRHQIIAVETLATGTVDTATVYPREVVRSAIKHNAAAVIFSHNHPSGNAEPSGADRALTDRLKSCLATVDIRVLDHIVVGAAGCVSFGERGWI